ncbi:odorant receptor 85f-like [Camponotus floridanus]|uniref:odorant receptor 85f-like n=1 Tax=Camponotus floridanus TaxID=104421 RepID=UPI000DC6BA0D|nr:odorant receptor 85f-like [Camponotus floridanus]
MKTHWNNGMDYGFREIRAIMCMLGIWPLQQNDLVCTFRWILIFIVESFTVTSVLIDSFKNCGDINDNLELFLIIEACFHAWLNVFLARLYKKKIATNVSSAIDDWSLSMKKQSYVVMLEHARLGRIIILFQLMIGIICAFLYFPIAFIRSKQQVAIIGNKSTTLWIFALPTSCLFKDISYSIYKAIFVMQILQGFIIYMSECVGDSFFFAITMHLCGQLELLRVNFVEVGRKITGKIQYRNFLGQWIRRHYELIILARNIEDAFNLNLLIRLSIITVFIAISGMRVIVSVKHQEYIDVMKSLLFIQYFIIQSFLFTHTGDVLRNKSESIASAIYDSTWHEFSSTTMKDLILIMMRTNVPLQLSAGKFFYITRSTTTDILKTALTYISFLQATMEK